MKKLISLVIAAAMSISIFGCAEKKPAPTPVKTEPTPDATKTEPAPTTDAPAPEGKAP